MYLRATNWWCNAALVPDSSFYEVASILNATHWLCLPDNATTEGDHVTAYKLYPLYLDIACGEMVIFDDNLVNSTAYLLHEGLYLKIETTGSSSYHVSTSNLYLLCSCDGQNHVLLGVFTEPELAVSIVRSLPESKLYRLYEVPVNSLMGLHIGNGADQVLKDYLLAEWLNEPE